MSEPLQEFNSAFPVPDYNSGRGLTARQLFASMAMQGALSNSGVPQEAFSGGFGGWPEHIAKYAVSCADALISELNKETEPGTDTGKKC